MSIFVFMKITNRNTMMNFQRFLFLAFLAFTICTFKSFTSRRSPSYTITMRNFTASPSGMIITFYKFGLPFCHTRSRTKEFFRMKIRHCSGKFFATPIADFNFPIRASWIGPSKFCLSSANLRTIFLIPFACGNTILSTNQAFINLSFRTPPIQKITLMRTKPGIFASIYRVKSFSTIITDINKIFISHIYNIRFLNNIFKSNIEIEEKYCEIAAKRLAQEVLF